MTREELETILMIGLKCSNEIRTARKNPLRKAEMVTKIASGIGLSEREVEKAFEQTDVARQLYKMKME
jgi:hypothetical protein